MGEFGAGEGKRSSPNLEISEARARLFIQSLPQKGIVLHGLRTANAPGVREKGLSPLGNNAHLYPKPGRNIERLANLMGRENRLFYFFLKVNDKPSSDEYRPSEVKKIVSSLRISINECLSYAEESGLNPDRLPGSIVLAKKPSPGLLLGGDHVPSYISRVKGALPIGESRLTIRSKDILGILTSSQNRKLLRSERADDLLRRVMDEVIDWRNNRVKSAGNPLQKVVSKFVK